MTSTPRRPPIFGPEPWTTPAGADWCHFDLWFAIVAVADFGGDLDALEAEMIARLRSSGHGAGAARRLGSDHWMPIVALAESATAAGRKELAVEVFRAADQPSLHRDHLRERCLKLTGVRLDDPHRRCRS